MGICKAPHGKHGSTNSNDLSLAIFKADPVHLCFRDVYGLVMWWLLPS